LLAALPDVAAALELSNAELWANFARSAHCERDVPPAVQRRVSPFQQLLVVQAVRPDRLQSAMAQFAATALGLAGGLAPPPLSLHVAHTTEAAATVPVLLLVTPGADPSVEIRELAARVRGAAVAARAEAAAAAHEARAQVEAEAERLRSQLAAAREGLAA
jgi:dynein heavy chain 2